MSHTEAFKDFSHRYLFKLILQRPFEFLKALGIMPTIFFMLQHYYDTTLLWYKITMVQNYLHFP